MSGTPARTEEERALLAPYVTSLDGSVFVLRNLPEEVIAVLFAYYSRSREDLRSNLLKLLQDQELAVVDTVSATAPPDEADLVLARRKAKEFHEKWVVGYGHASVAEHAVAHIAVEDVSIVVSKIIEDARLGSYTEKSTRYVPFPRAYYAASELVGESAQCYRETLEGLFDLYESLLPRVTDRIAETADRSQFKTERGFQNSCLAQACDVLRYLLPAATHTNIGLTANARTLEGMISKLLSHPLAEAREVGEQIQREATRVIPTLIKYARVKEYWRETPPALRALADGLLGGERTSDAGASEPVRLVRSPDDPEAVLAAAILYEFTDQPFDHLLRAVRKAGRPEQERVIAEYLQRRRTYGVPGHSYTDPPLRSLEHVDFTFDILVDYGAYRDIQRHRMATQTTQRLGCAHGYDVPELLDRYGFRGEFEAAMECAARAWERLAVDHPEEAQYVVPLAFRKRVLFTWNLRAIHHFVSLRSARQGHPSYRRIAQQVHAELVKAHPFLARFIHVDLEEYDMTRPG